MGKDDNSDLIRAIEGDALLIVEGANKFADMKRSTFYTQEEWMNLANKITKFGKTVESLIKRMAANAQRLSFNKRKN